jgi:hypothetical protein
VAKPASGPPTDPTRPPSVGFRAARRRVVGRHRPDPRHLAWRGETWPQQIPLFAWATSGALELFLGASVAWALATMTGSLQTTTFAELFEARHRTLGIGLAMSISAALFGGTAPYLNQRLYTRDLGQLSPAYVIGCALISGVAGCIMRESKGVDLSRGLRGTSATSTSELPERVPNELSN